MAKNKIGIDFNGFAEYAEKIDRLGGDLKRIFTEVMEQVAETVQADTLAALDDGDLPAKSEYSKGDTANAVIDDIRVNWSGYVIEMPLGFDFSKPGAGGWLITGTPRMRPDMALHRIYRESAYFKQRQKEVERIFQAEVQRLMGG